MTAHDDAMPDDLTDAEAFEGYDNRCDACADRLHTYCDFPDEQEFGWWRCCCGQRVPEPPEPPESLNDEGCTPGGWARSPI